MKTTVLAMAMLSVLVLSGCSSLQQQCAEINQHITTGTLNSNGVCCSGLEAKAPSGFVGGAWCVNPETNVYCLQGTETVIGINGQGIYAMQEDGSVTLLDGQISCPLP